MQLGRRLPAPGGILRLLAVWCCLTAGAARLEAQQPWGAGCDSCNSQVAGHGQPCAACGTGQCWDEGGWLRGGGTWGTQPTGPGSGLYAPGLYWIGPDSHWRDNCPQLNQYLPGYYRPVYGGNLPRWYVSAEYLALFRDSDQTLPFASLGPDPDNIVLSTAGFNADFQSGVRALVGVQWNDHVRLEGSYFGSYTWSDLASVNNQDLNDLDGIGNLFSPFTGFGNPADPAVDFNTTAVIEYTSRLNNAELNLRHRLLVPPGHFEASALLGVRYMNINESFGYLTANEGGTINQMNVETSNDLIGIQLGLLGQWLLTPWYWLDWEIKGAVAHNSASQNTVAELAGDFLADGRDEDTTSFIGETSVVLNYQFRPSLTLRVGYQAIWVTGLALADQNFETSLPSLFLGPARLDHSSDTVYHGFNIGLVFAR